MGVVIDMILAIAVIAVAAGTIAEFQIGIRNIRTPTYGAAVGVRSSLLGGREGDRSSAVRCFGTLFAHITVIGTNGRGQEIHHILAGEQQEICNANQREQVVREKENMKKMKELY